MAEASTPHLGGDEAGRLDAAIAAYLEAVDAGEPVDPDQWMQRYPDLSGPLTEFFDDQSRFCQLLTPAPLAPVQTDRLDA